MPFTRSVCATTGATPERTTKLLVVLIVVGPVTVKFAASSAATWFAIEVRASLIQVLTALTFAIGTATPLATKAFWRASMIGFTELACMWTVASSRKARRYM